MRLKAELAAAQLASQASMLDVAVVWLSRDLRLHDNPALSAALLAARKVVWHLSLTCVFLRLHHRKRVARIVLERAGISLCVGS